MQFGLFPVRCVQFNDPFLELLRLQVGSVDDVGGPPPHILKLVPFQPDPFADPTGRRERMTSPRFLVTVDDGFIGRFEKQHFGHHVLLVHFPQHLHQLIKKLTAADIHDQRDFIHPASGLLTQFGEFGNQSRRQIVNAKIAEILHKSHNLGLAGSRHAGNDDETRFIHLHSPPSFHKVTDRWLLRRFKCFNTLSSEVLTT